MNSAPYLCANFLRFFDPTNT